MMHSADDISDLRAQLQIAQEQLQQANDMLQALTNQRNAAQNECVQLSAAYQAEVRKVAALTAGPQATQPAAASKPNGHEATAALAH